MAEISTVMRPLSSAAEHLAAAAHERVQQVELARRELHRAAVGHHPLGGRVEFDLAEGYRIDIRRI